MEIRVLRYFLTVAREQNITRAAKSLHLTQPTLSRQLMDLEEELGRQLLIRGNRKITLTEEGTLLKKRAEEIVGLVDKTASELTSSDDVISGDVYIGCGETDAMRLLAQIAKQIQSEYPLVHYHLFSGNAQDVTEKLDKGLLDFGLLIELSDIEKYESLRLPVTDVWGVLMRCDSALATHDAITAENLWDLPLICSRQAMTNGVISGWVKKDAARLNVVATYNLIFNASLMVEEGLGYALGLDKLIKTPEDGVLCFRPLQPRLEVHVDIVWKKHQVFSKAAALFLKRASEAMARES